MAYYEFLQILRDCGLKQVFCLLSAKSMDRPAQTIHLTSHAHGKAFQLVMVNSTPGRLCLKVLWQPRDHECVPRGQIWGANRNFAWWGACWWACCTSGSPRTAPVSGTGPFVSLLSTGRIQIPPAIVGVCVWTSSAETRLVWALSSIRRWPWGPWAAGLTVRKGRDAVLHRSALVLLCSALPAEYLALGEFALNLPVPLSEAALKLNWLTKKPLVDKRALQVNNWLSSLNP